MHLEGLLVEPLPLPLHGAAERLLLRVELLEAGAVAGECHPAVVHHRLTAPDHVLVRVHRELVIP